MSLNMMLESTATITRPTIGKDARGGVTQAFTTVVSSLPCSVQQAGTSVLMLYAQRNTLVTNTIYFDQDPGCEINDRLEVTDVNGNTQTILVKSPSQPVLNRFIGGGAQLWQVDGERIV